jgi:hypothetical protein
VTRNENTGAGAMAEAYFYEGYKATKVRIPNSLLSHQHPNPTILDGIPVGIKGSGKWFHLSCDLDYDIHLHSGKQHSGWSYCVVVAKTARIHLIGYSSRGFAPMVWTRFDMDMMMLLYRKHTLGAHLILYTLHTFLYFETGTY